MALGPTSKKLEQKTPAEDELISSGQFTWQQMRRLSLFIRNRLHANGSLLRWAENLDIATERWLHDNFVWKRQLQGVKKVRSTISARDADFEPECPYCMERYGIR